MRLIMHTTHAVRRDCAPSPLPLLFSVEIASDSTIALAAQLGDDFYQKMEQSCSSTTELCDIREISVMTAQ